MQVTATEAKNRFGQICSQAKTGPVIVEKEGRPDSVILSYADYQALTHSVRAESLAQRRRAFNSTYKEWLDAQNQEFERNGLWCNGLVAWQEADDGAV